MNFFLFMSGKKTQDFLYIFEIFLLSVFKEKKIKDYKQTKWTPTYHFNKLYLLPPSILISNFRRTTFILPLLGLLPQN